MKSLHRIIIYSIVYLIAAVFLLWISVHRGTLFTVFYEHLAPSHGFMLFIVLLVFILMSLAIPFYITKGTFALKHWHLIFYSLLVLLFFLEIPLFSRDYEAYFISAKNWAYFGMDPYRTLLYDFAGNPWREYIADIWNGVSIYGPWFNLLMFVIALLPGFNLLLHLYAYKVVTLIAFLVSVYLVKVLSRQLCLNEKAYLLYALNPSVLLHFVAEVHNDVFVLAMLLASLVYFTRPARLNGIRSSFLFAFASNIKYVHIILMPLFWFKDKKLNIKSILSSFLGLALVWGVGALILPNFLRPFIEGRYNDYASACLYFCNPFIVGVRQLLGKSELMIRVSLYTLSYLYFSCVFLYKTAQPIKFIFWVYSFLYLLLITWVTPWALVCSILFAILLSKERLYLYLSFVLTAYSLFHYFL